ncbi:MAG: hypothetical protein E7463_11130 [Ruminococcaceae bacterium]|nr:hypothetical protein [Oscillospiraceae bacterium]
MKSKHISCAYPGGNIIVISEQDDVIELRQDMRDTDRWWFYWNFRAEGLQGREITFRFCDGDVVGYYGPAISHDGYHWSWLGPDSKLAEGYGFRYQFAPEETCVYFCCTLPYQLAHFQAFYQTIAANPAVQLDTLCVSEHGQIQPLLRIARPGAKCEQTILFTARHHACESPASYLMEGAIRAILEDPDCHLPDSCELLVAPFMDLDGAEEGDQGKSRAPHDHNRDYTDAPLYNSVASLMKLCRSRKIIAAVDFHDPLLYRSGDHLYYVQKQEPFASQQEVFANLLIDTMKDHTRPGGLKYDTHRFNSFGSRVNTAEMPTASRFFTTVCRVPLTLTLEVPYMGEPDAERPGRGFLADDYRHMGSCIARTLNTWHRQFDSNAFAAALAACDSQ